MAAPSRNPDPRRQPASGKGRRPSAVEGDKKGRPEVDEKGRERIRGVVKALADEAKRRVDKRVDVEARWLDDLAQYHGVYTGLVKKRLDERDNSSSIFVNLTRPKTDALVARLWDMLFPTDDRCWGIEPTPVPDLADQAEAAVSRAMEAKEEATRAADEKEEGAGAAADVADAAHEEAERLQAIIDEARKRAKAMEQEIDDALVQGRFEAAMRDVINDGCRIGAGVLRGPMLDHRAGRSWKQRADGVFELTWAGGDKPVASAVDAWGFFPDPDARSIEEGRGCYERQLMSKRELRRLARNPEFDRDEIREILRHDPEEGTPDYISRVRAVTGKASEVENDVYSVWLYSGPIDHEDLATLGEVMGDPVLMDDAERAEDDPLYETNVIAWFCQGRLLRIDPHPLDSGECLYSMFCLERDEQSPWGYGVPRIMANEQAALNGASRMLMDNAAITTGPQVVMDKTAIIPENGDWTLAPFKIWLNQGDKKAEDAFRAFNIDSRSSELLALIDHFQRHIDDVTGISTLAQGEQGADVTKTAQGMALLMNSGNIVFRRIVKIIDDDVIVPTIRKFYDWFMQHSTKESIKGDYEVAARGSSVLLVREMQAQNLLTLANGFGGHPIYGPMTKHAEVYREVWRAHGLRPDQFVFSDDEIKAAEANKGEDPEVQLKNREMDLKEQEIQANIERANMEAHSRMEVALANRETQMMILAEKMNMSMEEISATLEKARVIDAGQDRRFAAELAVTQRDGPSGGGNF